jgi:CRISPR-associated protein Cas2
MHYVICYDLENDRLRDRVVKILEKNGCHRIQKSVFTAPFMEKKHLTQLRAALGRLFARHPPAPADSLLIVPLPDEYVAAVTKFGNNNIHTHLQEKILKTIL